ncbi:MAG: site-specific integrase [Synergistaceae bacterium]|jgi:integrase|nr:site-specific integrase [Synergistaceae bacterium]
MSIKLTQGNFQTVAPEGKSRWINDTGLRGLCLYVAMDNRRTWYISYTADGRKSHHKLGSADVLTVAEARDLARDFLSKIARGEKPHEKKAAVPTLGEYLTDVYIPWYSSTHRDTKMTLGRISFEFKSLMNTPLDRIRLTDIMTWQTKRHEEVKAKTLNVRLALLRAALNHAVEIGLIGQNPIERVKRLKENDSEAVTRFLSPDEKDRLLKALDDPATPACLKPLVTLGLNSGLRKGSMLSLHWKDINFDSKTVTVLPEHAKGGKLIDLPLNSTAIQALATWRLACGNPPDNSPVFTVKNIQYMWGNLRKRADIKDFRFHDLRHSFASSLVQSGIDLLTVSKLCGHSNTAMTLRYSHLAPDGLRKAVAVLDDEKALRHG